MKRLILSWLILMPCISFARDRCTNPDEYTIDRRCYVTDEQKKTKPYNAVVRIEDCTGTIVRKSNTSYVYTAKHCMSNVENNRDVMIDLSYATLPDGRRFYLTVNNHGNYSKYFEQLGARDTDFHWDGDWAIYNIENSLPDIPYVSESDGQGLLWDDARIIGYGTLKIMSDTEIQKFKEMYASYLTEVMDVTDHDHNIRYGFRIIDEGVYFDNTQVQRFVNKFLTDTEYFQTTFNDGELKVSECKYSRSGDEIACQTWTGNAGGGIFDGDGDIMGIHLRNDDLIIGGKDHATSTPYRTSNGNQRNSINKQPEPTSLESKFDNTINFSISVVE